MVSITEWIRAYYGVVILIGFFMILLFWNSFMHFIKKNKAKAGSSFMQPMPGIEDSLFSLEQEGLFEDIRGKDALDNFQEQKVFAEKQIKQIKEEGKRLVRDETIFIQEYHQKKIKFERDRKNLGIKYTMWANQLKMIENMIVNQARIREEFDKMKEVN